jgi:hypothetical protein
MQVPGANVSNVLNWIAFVPSLSLPFSFFTRAGVATRPILRRAASATAG